MNYKSSPAKNLNKKGWLDFLFYKEGKQNFNFFVCGTYKKVGEIRFSKWKTYSKPFTADVGADNPVFFSVPS